MGLPARQRRRLENIEHKLRNSDPRLAAMFGIFGRLTRDEDMPRIEELRHRVAMLALRMRMWLAAVWSRVSFARRRAGAPVAVGSRADLRARRQAVGRPGGLGRPGGQSRRWRPMAVFFPLALVLMSLSIFVAAKFGSAPRCVAATAVATAKLHPRGKPLAKGGGSKTAKRCRPATLTPIPIGR
jgi:hypothetical protein